MLLVYSSVFQLGLHCSECLEFTTKPVANHVTPTCAQFIGNLTPSVELTFQEFSGLHYKTRVIVLGCISTYVYSIFLNHLCSKLLSNDNINARS